MSKIICDVCGTSYPDTAECCPICGCSRDAASSLLGEDLLEQTEGESTGAQNHPRKRKEIFDYDEVNSEPEEEEVTYAETEYDEEEEDDEEEPRQNTLVVIILTVLIALLLMAAGFIFVRYFLPNMGGKADAALQATQETQAAVTETTELSIPCQELYIISGKTVELNEEGQMFLLHVKASPENTTDKILFTSSDETVATVTEDGRITAVSEGEAVITIRCGVSTMECPVTVRYVEETAAPTTEAPETAPVPAEGGAAEPQSAETEASAEAGQTEATVAPAQTGLKNVTLKLKKTDIRLGVYYEFKLLLDCDLEQNEVQWSSEHPYIATVDENGVVKAIKSGTTAITATYGDQKVQCIVRCS